MLESAFAVRLLNSCTSRRIDIETKSSTRAAQRAPSCANARQLTQEFLGRDPEGVEGDGREGVRGQHWLSLIDQGLFVWRVTVG